MHSATRFSLIPGDTALTVAARGPMRAADADRLAALCLSLPAEVRALRVDLTGTGLVAADVLRRVSRAASSWRYTRAAALTLRFTASRESEQEPAADWVSVEIQFPPRRVASAADARAQGDGWAERLRGGAGAARAQDLRVACVAVRGDEGIRAELTDLRREACAQAIRLAIRPPRAVR